jgi:prepilin-type N-terminal cleavage/methylation domain-containing protein
MKFRLSRGFTLIELLVCAFIMLILLSIGLSYAPSMLLQRAIDREDAELKKLSALFILSEESTDYAATNVTAVTGEVPSGVTATTFSTALTTPVTTATTDWFAKLANLQGISVSAGTAPTRTAQPALANILLNERGNPRYCFAAPAETDRQRFIICSIIGESALTLPTYAATSAFFDSLWNTDFNTNALALPSYWVTNLTATQQTAWSGAQGGGSHLPRVRVVRIAVPKFTLTVNNNHATTYCWVYWNGGGGRMQCDPGSGVSVSSYILEGRQVSVTFGATEATATEKYRINIRKNTSVTVE